VYVLDQQASDSGLQSHIWYGKPPWDGVGIAVGAQLKAVRQCSERAEALRVGGRLFSALDSAQTRVTTSEAAEKATGK
jgi:hypothetical protein